MVVFLDCLFAEAPVSWLHMKRHTRNTKNMRNMRKMIKMMMKPHPKDQTNRKNQRIRRNRTMKKFSTQTMRTTEIIQVNRQSVKCSDAKVSHQLCTAHSPSKFFLLVFCSLFCVFNSSSISLIILSIDIFKWLWNDSETNAPATDARQSETEIDCVKNCNDNVDEEVQGDMWVFPKSIYTLCAVLCAVDRVYFSLFYSSNCWLVRRKFA